MYIIKRNHKYPYYVDKNDKNVISWSTTPNTAFKYNTLLKAYSVIAMLQRYCGDRTMRPVLETGDEIL